MLSRWRVGLLVTSIATAWQPTRGADTGPDVLQGVWVAESMETDGKAVPAETAKRMRLTFKGDKLLVRGNFADDREEECPYKVDLKSSPKHLDFTPPKEQKPILGIYEVKGDELKVCLRHASSSDGRPTEFATEAGSKLVLLVLKRQPPSAPPLLAADTAGDVRTELAALAGTWKAVAFEAGGTPLPKASVPDFTYVIAADGKATGKSPQGEYAATVTVDATTQPKAIDNRHESGPQAGKTQYGVYKLEGDKLTVCITAPGRAAGDRPKVFATKDSANVLFVFERVKAGKTP